MSEGGVERGKTLHIKCPGTVSQVPKVRYLRHLVPEGARLALSHGRVFTLIRDYLIGANDTRADMA